MKCTRAAIAFFAVTSIFTAIEADAQLLIGGAGSGAINENGDLQSIAPFMVPDSNVVFTDPRLDGRYTPDGSVLDDSVPGDFDIVQGGRGTFGFQVFDGEGMPVLNEQGEPTFGNNGGTVDEAFLTANGLTLADVEQINIFNGQDFAFASIPGFALTREGNSGGGSAVFGFDTGTSTPLDDNDIVTDDGTIENISAFANNGVLALTSDSITLDANVGANSTFTLVYDIAVDGASAPNGVNGDDITFAPTLTVGGVTLQPSAPTISVVNGAASDFVTSADNSSIQADGVDISATVTQEFTAPSDIFSSDFVLSIEFGETLVEVNGELVPPNNDGVDRGAIDNIQVSAVLEAVTTVAGDFDGDLTVDIRDYTVFRDSVGGDDSLINGAGVNDGLVDNLDFDVFVANFVASGGTGGVVAASVIPEPSAALSLFAGVLLLASKRRRG